MDALFIEGVAATVSAVVVFCGSVFLLLTMVLGARLAYLLTASITLGFLLIMGLVWSFTNETSPLGPVGTLPSWDDVAIAEAQAELEFQAAQQYPEDPWTAPNEDDEAEAAQAAELESSALEVLEQAINEGTIEAFTNVSQAVVAEDSARLLERDGEEYGAVTLEPVPLVEPTPSETNDAQIGAGGQDSPGGGEGQPGQGDASPSPSPTGPPAADPDARVYVVMQYDPGNPLGLARWILAGTVLLLGLHLFLLSRAERRSQRVVDQQREPAG
jgi:hypothetical protein